MSSVQKPALLKHRLRAYESWRAWHRASATGPSDDLVPKQEKLLFFPAFSVTWPFGWADIANGEQVILEPQASPLGETLPC